MANPLKKCPLFLIILFFVMVMPGSRAIAFDEKRVQQSEPRVQEKKPFMSPGMWLISFYRNHISAVDGDRCPSLPSCSSYSVQAIKKHGFFVGWVMTVDRLIHEGKEETTVSPLVFSRGKWKIYDPVENNDFWWFSREEKEHE